MLGHLMDWSPVRSQDPDPLKGAVKSPAQTGRLTENEVTAITERYVRKPAQGKQRLIAQEQTTEKSRSYSQLFPAARHGNDFAHLRQGEHLCLQTHPYSFHFISSSNLKEFANYKVYSNDTHFFLVHSTHCIEQYQVSSTVLVDGSSVTHSDKNLTNVEIAV